MNMGATLPGLREETMSIDVKRVYDPAAESARVRIPVDRIRPRGLTKKKAQLVATTQRSAC